MEAPPDVQQQADHNGSNLGDDGGGSGLNLKAELKHRADDHYHQQGDDSLYKGGHLILSEIGRIRPHPRFGRGRLVTDAQLAILAHH